MITRREIHFTPIHFALYLLRRVTHIQDPITPTGYPFRERLVGVSRTRFEFESWRKRDRGFLQVMQGVRERGLLL